MVEKVNAKGLTEKEFLKQYRPGDYERPSVTVDMLVLGMNASLDGLKVLLIQRKDHPFIDCWALAGGFVGIDESTYEAACRELEEETGLKNIYLEQVYTMSQPKRDPRMRVIDVAYMALIPVMEIYPGDDAKDALWFDLTVTEKQMIFEHKERNIRLTYDLKKTKFQNGVVQVENAIPMLTSETALAFDHAEIVWEAITRLRNKIEYSDVAFNLVPREFTLPDLQAVYETILGKELYKKNFREKIASKVEALEKKGTSITGGKKSILYKYKCS